MLFTWGSPHNCRCVLIEVFFLFSPFSSSLVRSGLIKQQAKYFKNCRKYRDCSCLTWPLVMLPIFWGCMRDKSAQEDFWTVIVYERKIDCWILLIFLRISLYQEWCSEWKKFVPKIMKRKYHLAYVGIDRMMRLQLSSTKSSVYWRAKFNWLSIDLAKGFSEHGNDPSDYKKTEMMVKNWPLDVMSCNLMKGGETALQKILCLSIFRLLPILEHSNLHSHLHEDLKCCSAFVDPPGVSFASSLYFFE
jgi:hypothetical protein